MQNLHFEFRGGDRAGGASPVLVGVVSSGNLEVLIEPDELDGACSLRLGIRLPLVFRHSDIVPEM